MRRNWNLSMRDQIITSRQHLISYIYNETATVSIHAVQLWRLHGEQACTCSGARISFSIKIPGLSSDWVFSRCLGILDDLIIWNGLATDKAHRIPSPWQPAGNLFVAASKTLSARHGNPCGQAFRGLPQTLHREDILDLHVQANQRFIKLAETCVGITSHVIWIRGPGVAENRLYNVRTNIMSYVGVKNKGLLHFVLMYMYMTYLVWMIFYIIKNVIYINWFQKSNIKKFLCCFAWSKCLKGKSEPGKSK